MPEPQPRPVVVVIPAANLDPEDYAFVVRLLVEHTPIRREEKTDE